MDTTSAIIDSCQVLASQHAPAAKSCCDCSSSWNSSAWITLMICLTVLILGIVLAWRIYLIRKNQLQLRTIERGKEQTHIETMKGKELEAKREEERKHYRSQLANFLELMAKGIRKDKDTGQDLDFNKELCNNYINTMQSLINNLKPDGGSDLDLKISIADGIFNPKTAEEIKKEEDEKTRKAFQDRLINFLERVAFKKETTIEDKENGKTEITRELVDNLPQELITKLQTWIDELKPNP